MTEPAFNVKPLAKAVTQILPGTECEVAAGESVAMKNIGKPYTGKRYARF